MNNLKKTINTLLFIFLFVLGCQMPPSASPLEASEERFAYVQGEVQLYICKKGQEPSQDICMKAEEGQTRASAVLIHNSSDKSYYLTAGHVCHMPGQEKGGYYSKIEKQLHLLNKQGDDHIATIIAFDEEKDLCLLSAALVDISPAKFATGVNKKDKVFNVAAPAGIWAKDMVLSFHGEYMGLYDGRAMYALNAQPGSSGSPIFNEKGQIVGILVAVITDGYFISVGPSLEDVRGFVHKNLREAL